MTPAAIDELLLSLDDSITSYTDNACRMALEVPSLRERLRSIVAQWAAGQSQWRPIETAPKDGTVVLLFKHSMDFKIRGYGYWEGGDAFVSGWISKGFDETFGNLGLGNPSHWMPLPESPL